MIKALDEEILIGIDEVEEFREGELLIFSILNSNKRNEKYFGK